MPNPSLKRTPLHSKHLQLGARMVPFAGYEMPVQYSGVLEETKAVRAAAGLFDVSHMGQFSIRGKNSLAEVNKLVTNDLTKIALGQAQYNVLCNDEGGSIDDLVIYRRSEEETYICVNASNRAVDFDWMKSKLPSSITLEDESDATALIALQGPQAEAILAQAAGAVAKDLKYYWAAEGKLFGSKAYISRTGYTGEDGFELYVPSHVASEVWDKLLELGRKAGLVPAGLGARDTLRTEMGYPLHGHELGATMCPLWAGLSWVVKLSKSQPFIGQKALEREQKAGLTKSLKAFIVQDRRIARAGYRIYSTSQELAGEITSGTHSPHVNAPIALGLVSKALVNETEFNVDVRGEKVAMKLAKLPFVPSKTKKS